MKNILITGGASGLGEAITLKLASDSSNKVFFTYFKSLEKDLHDIGFTSIVLWDSDGYSGDDFSKAYLPHMDENGILMSLNIEAIKQ